MLSASAAPAAVEFSAAALRGAGSPFAAALRQAAHAASEMVSPTSVTSAPDSALVAPDLAARLEQLLQDAGAWAGDAFQLSFDDEGAPQVDGPWPAVEAVQQSLAADSELTAALRNIVQRQGGGALTAKAGAGFFTTA